MPLLRWCLGWAVAPPITGAEAAGRLMWLMWHRPDRPRLRRIVPAEVAAGDYRRAGGIFVTFKGVQFWGNLSSRNAERRNKLGMIILGT